MKISILGCGWLGLPLGSALAAKGHEVKGSVTSEAKFAKLSAAGITPFLIQMVPEPEPQATDLKVFLDADVLIVAIPPKQRSDMSETFHAAQMQALVKRILPLPLREVIFISSTSVYPDYNRIVTESDEILHNVDQHNAVALAENVWRNVQPLNVTVLRCGGLMGYDRIPAKYVQGKKGLDNGEVRVNYIHRDDVIGIIEEVIAQKKWNRVFNVVAPGHPLRKEVFLKSAERCGFVPPTFKSPAAPHNFKVVSAEKVIMELGYKFKYPDPLHFDYDC